MPSTSLGLTQPQAVATFDDYEAAQAAVDYLVGQGLPADALAVVGTDLKPARAAKSTGWSHVAATGALSGLMWGLALAVLLWLFLPGRSLLLVIGCGLGFGVVYGVLSQAVQYAMNHERRNAAAAVAARYEVLAEAAQADQARSLLAGRAEPVGGAANDSAVAVQTTPADGERKTEHGLETPPGEDDESSDTQWMAAAAVQRPRRAAAEEDNFDTVILPVIGMPGKPAHNDVTAE